MAANMIAHICLAALCLSALAQAQYHTQASDLVQVPSTSGVIRGFRATIGSASNHSVYKFLSVPYAEAPTGELRFKRPVDLTDSNRFVDATRYGATCPQHRHLARFVSPLLNLDQRHVTSEDCLRLSVFVPTSVESRRDGNFSVLETSKRLPVIVWIPGEGFDFADERQFDGSLLASQSGSIVVSVQYRVGILGFLNVPAMNISGNMGLHDQLSALRWVQRNIDSFGGDRHRVTVMGRFSGSMSISALLTAPQQNLVKPLFNRAVLLSGLAVNDWIIDQQPDLERVESVLQLALKRGYCSQEQVDDTSCLQSMQAWQLLEVSGYGWKLAFDNELIGREDPIEAVKTRGLAPNMEGILLGETEAEGTLCLYRHMLNQQSDWAKMIEEDRLTPSDVSEMIKDDASTYFKYNVSQTNPIQMAFEALSNAGQDSERSRYLDACSAYMVKSHNSRFKRHLQARNKMSINSVLDRPVDIFHYSLKYKPTFSLAPEYIQTAAHGDDVLLIFGLIQNQTSVNQADLLMSQKMISYIKNFAHGNQPLTRTTRLSQAPSEARLTWAEPSTHPIVLSDGEIVSPSDKLALIQIHATSTTTTNMFGADVSFVSSLVLSSCLVIFALMSLCIVLGVILIRANSNSA